MYKINLKSEIIFWVILLIPFIYLAFIWNQLADRVPIHFNGAGEPNGWGNRNAELLMPVINTGTYLLLLFIPFIDPKKMNYESFGNIFYKIRLLLTAFFSGLSLIVINSGLSGHIAGNGRWIIGPIFLLFAFLGNYMINVKPNWFIGIRTPWTLSNDTVWRKTHSVGGRIFFYGGLMCFVLVFILPPQWLSVMTLTFVLGAAAFTFIYSYWLFKKEEQSSSPKM